MRSNIIKDGYSQIHDLNPTYSQLTNNKPFKTTSLCLKFPPKVKLQNQSDLNFSNHWLANSFQANCAAVVSSVFIFYFFILLIF